MKLSKLFLIPAVAMVYLASDQKVQAVASNNPPPVGNVIIDLDGTPIPHAAYVQYSANFLATDTSTAFSIAMREDPAFILLDDVSVTDLTTPSGELLVNGGFESGILGNNAPVGWTYLNTFGAAFAGVVANTAGQAHTGSFFYFDGAVQAYDGISQTLATTVGHLYHVSLWVRDNGGLTTFSRLSTNGNTTDTGGNGADVLVYAGAIPVAASVPEGGTTALLLGLAMSGFGFARRYLTK